MSDKLVERLREYAQVAHMAAAWGFAGEGYTMEKAADRIEELEAKLRSMALDCLAADGQAADAYQAQLLVEAKLAKAVELVEGAFNEGFGEGMNDVLRQRGGKTWYDSRSRKRLAELKGKN